MPLRARSERASIERDGTFKSNVVTNTSRISAVTLRPSRSEVGSTSSAVGSINGKNNVARHFERAPLADPYCGPAVRGRQQGALFDCQRQGHVGRSGPARHQLPGEAIGLRPTTGVEFWIRADGQQLSAKMYGVRLPATVARSRRQYNLVWPGRRVVSPDRGGLASPPLSALRTDACAGGESPSSQPHQGAQPPATCVASSSWRRS